MGLESISFRNIEEKYGVIGAHESYICSFIDGGFPNVKLIARWDVQLTNMRYVDNGCFSDGLHVFVGCHLNGIDAMDVHHISMFDKDLLEQPHPL